MGLSDFFNALSTNLKEGWGFWKVARREDFRIVWFFLISWVLNWHILSEWVIPPFCSIPLFDKSPFQCLVHSLVNYNLPEHLLLSHNKLLSFTILTYWWPNQSIYYFNLILFYVKNIVAYYIYFLGWLTTIIVS